MQDHFGKANEIEVPLESAPISVIFQYFQVPPFLKNAGIQSANRSYSRSERIPNDLEHRRRQTELLKQHNKRSITVDSNEMITGSLEPVLQKIAVGLFWAADPTLAKKLEVGKRIFDLDLYEGYGAEGVQSDFIFSLPSSDDFGDELYVASLFPAWEEEKIIQYASIRLFPATMSPTYFYRFGELDGQYLTASFKSTDT